MVDVHFWKQGFCCDVTFLYSGSRRVCAIRCTSEFGQILFLNAYMPWKSDEASKVQKLARY